MICDLGDRVVGRGMLPRQSLEIEVLDPLDGSNLYGYFAATRSPSRSRDKYVRYDAQRQTVTTNDYQFGMKNELPQSFALGQRGAGSGGDLVQGFEARGDARVLKLIPIHFSERDVRSEMFAYRIGPVRVIRKVRHWMSLGLGLDSPTAGRTEFFYRDSIYERAMVNLPSIPGLLFDGIRVRFDMGVEDISGLTLPWSGAPGLTLASGSDSWASRIGDHSMADWFMLGTPNGALFGGFLLSGPSGALAPQLYYKDGASGGIHSDWRSRPRIGYLLTGWQKLSRGPHPIDFVVIQAPAKFTGESLSSELHVSPTFRIQSADR